MSKAASKRIVQELLAHAEVEIDGSNSWDIQVHNDDFYRRVLSEGTLGLGESYMDGWWDCDQIDVLFYKLIMAELHTKVRRKGLLWEIVKAKLFNLQSRKRALRDIQSHYDVGNDLYQKMLDKRMVYTCAYWKDAKNLDEAQEAKLDLVCRKVGLQPGMRILDIGCGWGSWAKYAAEKYGVEVVGVTLAEEQVKLGQELCQGLPVEIRLQDYRDVTGRFDHIVAIGVFEHIGPRNYRTFMEKSSELLADDGLLLVHTIGAPKVVRYPDPWSKKYIFPNAVLPAAQQIIEASQPFFMFEDWHNFGSYYDQTCMAWYENLQPHWEELSNRYDERFQRMWNYYLLHNAGASARSRKNNLWQIVFSKQGVAGGYKSVR